MSVELMAELVFDKQLESEILPIVSHLVIESRKENGNEQYDAFHKSGGIVIFERWESEQHLEKHKMQQHFVELVHFIEANAVGLNISQIEKFL